MVLDFFVRKNYLGMSLSLSQHNSNIPNKTLETSKYGSHTAKPRPIKSTAALRSAMWAGNLVEDGVKSNWVNAKPS